MIREHPKTGKRRSSARGAGNAGAAPLTGACPAGRPGSDLVVLGSGSKRRRKILGELGIRFRVAVPRVTEASYPNDARKTACVNCRRKMAWCRARYPSHRIITADTVVEFRGRCIPKPASMEEAVRFLRMFSGKEHNVLTAVAMAAPGRRLTVKVEKSRVTFKPLSARAVAEYLGQVDPLDKAGAYNIDQASGLIIRKFAGSYTNIVGLPVEVVLPWLEATEPRVKFHLASGAPISEHAPRTGRRSANTTEA